MFILSHNQKRNQFRLVTSRSIVLALIVSLIFFQPISYAQQASVLGLPKPGTMVDLSPAYVPVIVKGLRVHPENPILFDFILDTGNSGLGVNNTQLRSESEKLIKYFLASLTIPEDDLWVNLSPYEKNRIIPEQLGQTVMGRDMLAQDYILKQLTASLIYPEKSLGKEFWNKVYAKAQNLFGSSNIPVNTFNKVWILADKAKVYVHDNTAFVVACHMKVMLEEDYLSLSKHAPVIADSSSVIARSEATKQSFTATNALGSQIVREVIIPELEKEVNDGKNFAKLRQIYNSMILAAWYKKNLKEALLNQVYSNKDKINGINVSDKTIREQIYQQYLKAYKKGVFNYIKEDMQADGQVIPRKYFSGGEVGIRGRDVQEVGLGDADAAMFAGSLAKRDLLDVSFISQRVGGTTNSMVLLARPSRDFESEGEGLFDKAQAEAAAETKNKAMTTVDYDIADIKGASAKHGTQEGVEYTSQVGESVRFSSRHGLVFRLGTPKILIVNDNEDVKNFGIRFDQFDNVLYIELAAIRRLEEKKNKLIEKWGANGDLDIITRKFIYSLYEGKPEIERKEAEYSYAYEKFPHEVIAKFPSTHALPQVVMENLSNSMIRLFNPRQITAIRNALGFDDRTRFTMNISESTIAFERDALNSARDSLYEIAINALDGVINLKQRIRLQDSDDSLKGDEDIKAGMLAFAANPPTVAHTITAMLKSMADNKFDVFFAALTKGDFRKPALQITFETRQKVLELLIGDLFGGLIKVAPPLEVMSDDGKLMPDPGYNGEEKIREYLRLNKDARSFSLGYVAGLDHFASFAHKDQRLTFLEITDDNRKDFEYYVKLPGYSQLIRRYWDSMRGFIPEEDMSFFEQLKESANPLDLLKVGATFPVLDTVGKLYLIQDYLNRPETKDQSPQNTKIALINIGRLGESSLTGDRVRNSISKEERVDGRSVGTATRTQIAIYTNSGFPHVVSATLLRTGMDKLVREREFDLNLLRAMHLEVFKMAMGHDMRFPQGPRLLGIWLRTQSVGAKTRQDMPLYPRAIETMLPNVNGDVEHQRQVAFDLLRVHAEQILGQADYRLINVRPIPERNPHKSVIEITGNFGTSSTATETVAEAEQGWIAYFDRHGNNISEPLEEVNLRFFPPHLTGEVRDQLRDALINYFRSINDYSRSIPRLGYTVYSRPPGIRRDAAMANPTGGIDLNSQHMQMDVNGETINLKFDPAMFAQFQRGDFSGVVPVIIQITPIQDPLALLGVNPGKQVEPELSKV